MTLHAQVHVPAPAPAGGATLVLRHGPFALTGATSVQFQLTGIGAGNVLVAGGSTTTTRSLTAMSDDQNGAWTILESGRGGNTSNYVDLTWFAASAGGTLNVTRTYSASLSSSTSEVYVWEISAGATVATSQLHDQNDDSTSKVLANPTLSIAGQCVGCVAVVNNSNPGTYTPPADWTYIQGTDGGNRRHFFEIDTAAGLSGQYPYTHSTARKTVTALAVLQ